ncbi:amino acid ABC transporter permease [Frigidibacter sp. ROC022]|uniref:amino acid ABC transporter permease n=1 Tax=Frigidibacter sp. ROC022 TaxID=2971796 RepID=UPI00215A15AD|nr:amino acid ABC transporter permease [Frigidibacter sp. ROC022]MCR8725999.1 amino acid ABC transporter permease [Frigidibacter sp. ROC022]
MNYNFKFSALWPYMPEILSGVILTLQLASVAMLFGLAIGLAVAIGRVSSRPAIRMAARVYVEAIRNTPLLVQLFIVFFGLPSLGLRLGANTAAVIALSINLGAYSAEILRAGFESVRVGQVEAGRSLGLTAAQTFRHVVLFPAIKAIYPALASQFVLLMLTTSVVSSIGVTELFGQAAFIDSRTYRSFEVYTLITLSYLVFTLGFRALFSAIYWAVFVRRSHR